MLSSHEGKGSICYTLKSLTIWVPNVFKLDHPHERNICQIHWSKTPKCITILWCSDICVFPVPRNSCLVLYSPVAHGLHALVVQRCLLFSSLPLCIHIGWRINTSEKNFVFFMHEGHLWNKHILCTIYICFLRNQNQSFDLDFKFCSLSKWSQRELHLKKG